MVTMEMVSTNFTAILDIAKDALGLLSEFPLNIIVTMSIAGGVFSLIRKGKRVAR